jgi:glycosyltransferase involved in cell wall biosynthesis
MDTFDAIVPCYNEASRLKKVLSVLVKSSYINHVIVVNDGSTDSTIYELKKFPAIITVNLKKNTGKGNAIKVGCRKVTTPAVFLFDADLSGLTEQNIADMYHRFRKNPACLVVGLREKSEFYIVHWLRSHILPLIAGERILATSTLRQILKNKKTKTYGLEAHMNHYFNSHNLPIRKVLLKGVNDIPKWRKSNYGIAPQIEETIHVARQYLDIYYQKASHELYGKNTNYLKLTLAMRTRVKNKVLRELASYKHRFENYL